MTSPQFQDNKQNYTPQWVVDKCPTGENILIRSCNFKKQLEYKENVLSTIPSPMTWRPSDDSVSYLEDDSNWIPPDGATLLNTNDRDHYLDRRSIQQQKDDYLHEQCMKECFPENIIGTFHEIEQRFQQLGKKFNFLTSRQGGNSLICSKGRGGPLDTSGKNTLRSDCKCKITVAFLYSLPKTEGKNKRVPYDYKCNQNALCMITKVYTSHNHPRDQAERSRSLKRSGKINKSIPEAQLHQLLLYAKSGTKLTPEIIRTTLTPCFPDGYTIDAHDLNNLRKKVQQLYKTMTEKQLNNFDDFCEAYKSRALHDILSDSFDYGVNVSAQRSLAMISDMRRRGFLSTPSGKVGESFDDPPEHTIASMNVLWKEMDPNFDFRLDIDNLDGSIRGISWQSGAQRDNFSRNGSYISLDVCKRDYCSSGHYYISVTMRRANGSICMAIESLVEAEDVKTYAWLIDCLFQMCSPDMKPEDIRVVAADQFLNQGHVTYDLALPNAILLMDWWHLENKNFPDNFKVSYVSIRTKLCALMRSHSELDFNDTMTKIEQDLCTLNAPPAEHNYLQSLSKLRKHFASYELMNTECTFGLHGSTASETNHSSLHSMLGSEYYEQPLRMQADLMTRELYHQRIFDKTLATESLALSNFNRVATETGNRILQQASANIDGFSLNLSGYKKIQIEVSKLKYLTRRDIGEGRVEIKEVVDGIEVISIFPHSKAPCPLQCSQSKSQKIQCRHELKCYGDFDISRFNKRYHYHKNLTLRRRNGTPEYRKDVHSKKEEIHQHSVCNLVECPSHCLLSAPNGTNISNTATSSAGSVQSSRSPLPLFHTSSSKHKPTDTADTTTEDYGPMNNDRSTVNRSSYEVIRELADNIASRVSNAPEQVREQTIGLLYEVTKISTSDWNQYSANLDDSFQRYVNANRPNLNRKKGRISRLVGKGEMMNSHMRNGNRKRSNVCISSQSMPTTKRKKVFTCSFCGESGHKINSTSECMKQNQFRMHSKPYKTVDDLKNRIKSIPCLGSPTSTISALRYCNQKILIQSSGPSGGKHFIIHSVHPKNFCANDCSELSNIDLRITAINSCGDIVPSFSDVFICASKFFDKADNFGDKRLIFDQTDMCIGQDGYFDRYFFHSQMSSQPDK